MSTDTPLAAALSYVQGFGWHILPCQWRGEHRKQPLLEHGFRDASNDPATIIAWWERWPDALIGVATGASGLAALDIDVKDRRKYGPDSLEALGRSQLDTTWISHTASGGWHVLYAADPDDGCKIPSTEGTLGAGLDVRGSTGYIIAPSPGSGYSWDPLLNPDTVPLAAAPAWLIAPPPRPATARQPKPVHPCEGLSVYGDAAIELACTAIRAAASGQQRTTLRNESYSIGRLAGAGGIPATFARAALIDAGNGMRNYDARRPWTDKEIRRVVNYSFDAGVARPRPTTNGRAAQ